MTWLFITVVTGSETNTCIAGSVDCSQFRSKPRHPQRLSGREEGKLKDGLDSVGRPRLFETFFSTSERSLVFLMNQSTQHDADAPWSGSHRNICPV
jgi:hypothetical protein